MITYQKDIKYPLADKSSALRELERIKGILGAEDKKRKAAGDFGSYPVPGAARAGLHRVYHVFHGHQWWVSKSVSDDLIATDFGEPDFLAVPWSVLSIEFFFEDKALPTILAAYIPYFELWSAILENTGTARIKFPPNVQCPPQVFLATDYIKDGKRFSDNVSMFASDMDLFARNGMSKPGDDSSFRDQSGRTPPEQEEVISFYAY